MDLNAYTLPWQLTKSVHRDVYPALDPSNPKLSATGKKVIITGAGGQIGSDTAAAWAMAGAMGFALLGRNVETLKKTEERIKTLSKSASVVVHAGDVASENAVKTFYEKIVGQFGGADVLINNAGALTACTTGEVEPAMWWQNMETNTKGPYLMSHYFIKHFGGKGTIINISTSVSSLVLPGMSSYAVSKLALTKMSEFFQVEHPELRVFSVMPGLVASAMTVPSVLPFAIDDGMLTGGMSLYLCTAKADFLKGSSVSVNWDIEEMEQHTDEIVEKGLLKCAFLNAKLGPKGQPWGT